MRRGVQLPNFSRRCPRSSAPGGAFPAGGLAESDFRNCRRRARRRWTPLNILVAGIGAQGVMASSALGRDGGASRRQRLNDARLYRPFPEERSGPQRHQDRRG